MEAQPKIFPLLFLAETVERFSYWGVQSILLLYLIKSFLMSSNAAYTVYGAFTALTFFLSLIGGIIADRFFGFKKIFLLGIFSSFLGSIALSMSAPFLFSIGLALVVCGLGFVAPTNASLLGTLYHEKSTVREKGFTLFYMGTNLGGILGPIVYGILSIYSWHYPFELSAVCFGLWLLAYFIGRHHFKMLGMPPNGELLSKKRFSILFCVAMIAILIVLTFLIRHPLWVGKLLAVIGPIALILLIIVALYKSAVERNRILMLLLMIGVVLLLFASIFQTYSSLIMFIDQHVDRHFANWTIPPSVFSSLEPFFVVVLAPLTIRLWSTMRKQINEPLILTKLALGLCLASVGFGVFAMAAYEAGLASKGVSILWILLGNIFLGAGEVFIMPPLISAITALSPTGLKGTMMGFLYLSVAYSGYIAGWIARLTGASSGTGPLITGTYLIVYRNIALFVLVVAGLVWLLSVITKRIAPTLLVITRSV